MHTHNVRCLVEKFDREMALRREVDRFEYRAAVEIFPLPLPALGLLSLSTCDESRFKSRRNLNKLSNITKIAVVVSWRDHGNFDKIVDVSVRLQFSRQDLRWSWTAGGDLGGLRDISEDWTRSQISWPDLGCLGKITARLSISLYEAWSHLSGQDRVYLGEITKISVISRQNFYIGVMIQFQPERHTKIQTVLQFKTIDENTYIISYHLS